MCTFANTHTPCDWKPCRLLGTLYKDVWMRKLIKSTHISVTPIFSNCSSQPHTHCYHSFSIEPAQSLLHCLHSHAPTNNRNIEPPWRSKYLLLFVLTLEEALESSATLLFCTVLLPPIVKLPPVCFTIAHPLGEQWRRRLGTWSKELQFHWEIIVTNQNVLITWMHQHKWDKKDSQLCYLQIAPCQSLCLWLTTSDSAG